MSPDDTCGVCDETRENHGDKNHEFNIEGNLVPKKPAEPPRQTAPKERGEAPSPKGVEEMEKAFLRLNEVLIEKGILDARDIVRILGGPTS